MGSERKTGGSNLGIAGQYEWSMDRIAAAEAELVRRVTAVHGPTGVAAITLPHQHPASGLARTLEAAAFAGEGYDFSLGMAPYEDRSTFLLTMDLDAGAIAHCSRVVTALPLGARVQGRSGIEPFDDRTQTSTVVERATIDEILSYHRMSDPLDCFNVATNFSTRRVEKSWEAPHTLVNYKCLFKLAIYTYDVKYIACYLNRKAVASFESFGLDFQLLVGREFHLPVAGQMETFDNQYVAAMLPASKANRDLFLSAQEAGSEIQAILASVPAPLYSLGTLDDLTGPA